MKPELKIKSKETDDWFNDLLKTISSFECNDHFSSHIGMSQAAQKIIVSRFQSDLTSELNRSDLGVRWQQEYSPVSLKKDSVDIYAEGGDFAVAIELDKNRADQVAKKFVSRFSIMPNKKIYFISLCYPGTDRMNANECIKYFCYCEILATRMGGVYAGFIIQ